MRRLAERLSPSLSKGFGLRRFALRARRGKARGESKEQKRIPHPDNRPFSVCIVGSGPAGFYTAKYLAKAIPHATIDMVDRLPTPYGLVRNGVAPDHPEVKAVQNDFMATLKTGWEQHQLRGSEHFQESHGGAAHNGQTPCEGPSSAVVRFHGNVELGGVVQPPGSALPPANPSDGVHGPLQVTVDTLRRHFDAVVLAYGAQGNRKLHIPGVEGRGVYTAREFVNWYNGHLDHVEDEYDVFTDTASQDTTLDRDNCLEVYTGEDRTSLLSRLDRLHSHQSFAEDSQAADVHTFEGFLTETEAHELCDGLEAGADDVTEACRKLAYERVCIVGHGNVAVDIARVLATNPKRRFGDTDMPSHIVDALSDKRARHIYMMGRRGPAQAAFTTKELRELSRLSAEEDSEIACVVSPEGWTQVEQPKAEPVCEVTQERDHVGRVLKRKLKLLDSLRVPDADAHTHAQELLDSAETTESGNAASSVHIRFLWNAVRVVRDCSRLQPGENEQRAPVLGVLFQRARLQGAPGSKQAVSVPVFGFLPCSSVLFSVGYQILPVDGVPSAHFSHGPVHKPYDGSVMSQAGRVLCDGSHPSQDAETPVVDEVPVGGTDAGPQDTTNQDSTGERSVCQGLYAVGWLKRGPTGVIASNIPDAQETVASVVQDYQQWCGARLEPDGGLLADKAGWGAVADQLFTTEGQSPGPEEPSTTDQPPALDQDSPLWEQMFLPASQLSPPSLWTDRVAGSPLLRRSVDSEGWMLLDATERQEGERQGKIKEKVLTRAAAVCVAGDGKGGSA